MLEPVELLTDKLKLTVGFELFPANDKHLAVRVGSCCHDFSHLVEKLIDSTCCWESVHLARLIYNLEDELKSVRLFRDHNLVHRLEKHSFPLFAAISRNQLPKVVLLPQFEVNNSGTLGDHLEEATLNFLNDFKTWLHRLFLIFSVKSTEFVD